MLKGLMFDLDGTIYSGPKLYPGVKELLVDLKKKKVPYVFVTNTTSSSPEMIKEKLEKLGINLSTKDIITPVVVAKKYLKKNNIKNIAIVRCEALEPIFDSYNFSENPEIIILADDGNGLLYEDINKAFEYYLKGAKITTLLKNKYYERNGKLIADLGFYVAGFKYITDEKIINFGKPSKDFFNVAKEILGIDDSKKIAMIGDDIEFDVLGAQKLGYRGFLVKTGKYRKGLENKFKEKPNNIIDSATSIVDYI